MSVDGFQVVVQSTAAHTRTTEMQRDDARTSILQQAAQVGVCKLVLVSPPDRLHRSTCS